MNNNSKSILHRLHFDSPIGSICIEDDGDALCSLYLDDSSGEYSDTSSELLYKTKTELLEYFEGNRHEFDIPLHFYGTDFQVKVWEALTKIPYGTVVSYADIAKAIGNPKACRAVGGANRQNPIMIIAACHRVVAKSDGLGGFSVGVEIKKKLLAIEKILQ